MVDARVLVTPPRAQYGATLGKAGRRNQLRYPGLASPAYPCNASIITEDETRSAIRVCSNGFTATELIRTGTEWTKRLHRIIENRIDKRIFRTHQYGLVCTQANS